MKKAILLLAIMTLLCGCAPQNVDQTPSTQNNESIQNSTPTQNKDTQPDLTQGSEQTDPTEPPVVELSVADWQLEEPEYLSYEEYFSTTREFTVITGTDSPRKWVKDSHIYEFGYTTQYDAFQIQCLETGSTYIIPDSGAYIEYFMQGADGRYGYLESENEFLRMDLETGETKVLLSGNFSSICFRDNLVVYYLNYADEKLTLGRYYLPTGKTDIFAEISGEFVDSALYNVKSTTDPMVLWMKNPEIVDLVKTELANPNSQYKKMWVNGGTTCWDYSEFWEAEDGLDRILSTPILLHHFQDTSGIRALLQYTYNPSDGNLTKKTGVIDNCFHGSDLGHDHFNPEITTAEPVELIMGQWKDLLNALPDIIVAEEIDTDMLMLPDVNSNRYLYGHNNKKLIDTPVSAAVNTGNGAIYISADKRSVYAVSYAYGQSIEIYRSAEKDITFSEHRNYALDREKQWLVIMEGDTLVQIDLAAGKYRELASHEYLESWFYIDRGMTTVYFEVLVGLYKQGYTIDIATGELREHYRL